MASILFNSLSLLYSTFFISCLIHVSHVESSKVSDGFIVPLIHRDSPLSPFYNPSHTHFDRLRNAIHRSQLRASYFRLIPTSNHTLRSPLIPNSGEYLMNLSIGTPPFNIIAIVDTGSSITWNQCEPCMSCYRQIAPVFNPNKSSTYKPLSCKSSFCKEMKAACSANDDVCKYSMIYGDGSISIGDYAEDTFTFDTTTSGEAVSIPKMVFGCGHYNQGVFNESASGLIGLGADAPSFQNQLYKQINGKFSYCLAPPDESSNVTGKISFGSNATVSGSGVVSTPIIFKTPKTYYFLNLEGITVGKKTLPYISRSNKTNAGMDENKGNIIIDSGTTISYLSHDIYDRLESAMAAEIGGKRVQNPPDPFGLCYQMNADEKVHVPKVKFHFAGGADVELREKSMFMKLENGLVCFAIVGTDDPFGIFGNLAQMNLLVGYDLVNKTVSFKSVDCTKI